MCGSTRLGCVPQIPSAGFPSEASIDITFDDSRQGKLVFEVIFHVFDTIVTQKKMHSRNPRVFRFRTAWNARLCKAELLKPGGRRPLKRSSSHFFRHI